MGIITRSIFTLHVTVLYRIYRAQVFVDTTEIGRYTVCFNGPNTPLSNLYKCDVEMWYQGEKLHFRSVEHAYHWAKLTWLGYTDKAEWVKRANSPLYVMRESRKFLRRHCKLHPPLTDRLIDWKDNLSENLMRELVLQKAHRCSEFVKILSENVGKHFMETTLNPFWGVGLSKRQLRSCTELELLECPGKNRLGVVLNDLSLLIRESNSGELPYPCTLDFLLGHIV